jgi:hypothetical protein
MTPERGPWSDIIQEESFFNPAQCLTTKKMLPARPGLPIAVGRAGMTFSQYFGKHHQGDYSFIRWSLLNPLANFRKTFSSIS